MGRHDGRAPTMGLATDQSPAPALAWRGRPSPGRAADRARHAARFHTRARARATARASSNTGSPEQIAGRSSHTDAARFPRRHGSRDLNRREHHREPHSASWARPRWYGSNARPPPARRAWPFGHGNSEDSMVTSPTRSRARELRGGSWAEATEAGWALPCCPRLEPVPKPPYHAATLSAISARAS